MYPTKERFVSCPLARNVLGNPRGRASTVSANYPLQYTSLRHRHLHRRQHIFTVKNVFLLSCEVLSTQENIPAACIRRMRRETKARGPSERRWNDECCIYRSIVKYNQNSQRNISLRKETRDGKQHAVTLCRFALKYFSSELRCLLLFASECYNPSSLYCETIKVKIKIAKTQHRCF